QIEAAARDGSIEDLLTWHRVSAGDVYYLPAGTVHAIGPGLALVEVQQNSDTTFRLFDYGRPRELHLERAVAVAQGAPYGAEHRTSVAERGATLIDGRYFRLDRVEGVPDASLEEAYREGVLALPLSGAISSKDAGPVKGPMTGIVTGPGQCLYAPSLGAIDFTNAEVTLLTCSR
ncbi:MAG: mannose-6-phosphate isomerase, partial [Pseudomonadota bacterium]